MDDVVRSLRINRHHVGRDFNMVLHKYIINQLDNQFDEDINMSVSIETVVIKNNNNIEYFKQK